MALIDNDDVPPSVLQIVPVFEVVLEGVNRNNGAVVKIEGVVVTGDAVPDSL